MPQDMVILSPEKSVIAFSLAGLGSRIGAQVLDALIIIALVVAEILVVLRLSATALAGPSQFLFMVVFFATPFIYFILFEGFWNGQTIGKKAAGVRVRMADGSAITMQASITRNLLRIADFLPSLYLAGTVMMFLTPRAQRLGDMAAGTVVLYDKRRLPFFTPAPYVRGEHACEKYLPDLRTMTVEEYIALKRLCDRFPQFPTSVQIKVMRELWVPLQRKLDIPETPNVHPISMAEAVVMKYGREHGLM